MSLKILAIDPGYDRVGVAVLETGQPSKLIYSSCVVTNKSDLQEMRLKQIFDETQALIQKHQPEHIALETLFFSVNKKTAVKVAEARGVIVLVAGLSNLPLIELSPQEVKLAMTGVGNASKAQVAKMVVLTLKIDIKNKLDDEIDAIALGFAASESVRLKKWGL